MCVLYEICTIATSIVTRGILFDMHTYQFVHIVVLHILQSKSIHQ